MIQNSLKAFKAEWLKLKGSGILLILLLMSLFIPLLFTVGAFFFGSGYKDINENQWDNFIGNAFNGFAGFFFPIFLILVVVNICQTEFKHGGWKLIETQPIHRFYLFLGKFKVAIVLSLICLLCFLFFSLLGATIYSIFNSEDVFFKQPIPLKKFLLFILRLWIAGFGLMALQYILSIAIPNFALPFIIGFVMIVAASIMNGFGVGNWLPYAALSQTASNINGSSINAWLLHNEKLSIAWMFLFLWIGYQYFYFKGWMSALFVPISKLIKLIIAILIFAVAFWWIEQSVVLKKYHKTVIAGIINSEDSIKHNELVIRRTNGEKILSVPILNNKFHASLDKDLSLGIYFITIGKNKFEVVFSTNDSLYCDFKINKEKTKAKFFGTRVAENELYRPVIGMDDYYLKNSMHEYNPKEFCKLILERIERQNKRINEFETSDKIKPADDFIKMYKKLKSIEYLGMLNVDYPKMFALYHPNEKLVFPKEIESFEKSITLNDTTLIQFGSYIEYLSQSYRSKIKIRASSYDTSLFNYINDQAKNKLIKNAILNKELRDAVSNVRDSTYRNYLITRYVNSINNEDQKNNLIVKNRVQNSFQKGKPAAIFFAETLLGDTISLQSLKGRYLLIDVWATWCAPCKQESPYFDDLSEKYTSENLAFISISVDEEKFKWKRESGDKAKTVLQLWALNKEIFMSFYGIEGIPRFMLIDPEGKIVNINMARPSEEEFENILKREVLKIK